MTEKRRWKEMDMLRGMAILMVLLYHSILVFPVNLHEIMWCRMLHTFLWTVQMPLFFLVSGFCYSFRGSYREYVVRKCRRILIPHLVFSALDILPRLIPNPFVHEQMDLQEAVTDLVLYGGSDWFLWTLFVIVLLFPALERLLTGRNALRRAGIFLVVLLFLAKPYITDLFLMNMVSQYLWYFFLGYGLRRKADHVFPKLKRPGFLLPALASMLLFFAGFVVWNEEVWGGTRLLEVVCVLSSFLFFFALSGCCGRRLSGFLTDCGTWSLQMYLLDAYALVLTRTLLVSVLGLQIPAFIILGNFLADTVLVLLISKYILTKAKVFRIFCGIPEKG